MTTPSPATPQPATPLPPRAVLLMLGSALLFALMAVSIRLASAQLHPFQITFFRSAFGALFALPLLHGRGLRFLHTPRFGFYLVRCVIGMGGMLAGFWAIVNLPLAEAVALSYSSPLFVTIGAVLFLGEVVRMRRWSAVVAGFIGVLVIVRPGSDAFATGSLVALLAAALTGAVTISIKSLTGSEPADRIVLLTTLLWIPLSLPAALAVWQWPHAQTWPWLVLSGAFGTGGHYCWTRALRLADASLLAPFSYLQLLLVAALAWWLFGEVVDRYTAAGALIIVCASLYIAWREHHLAQQQRRLLVAATSAEPTI
ncbi:DMT family transporter [Rhodanobacter sp. AS-Z3]|uniref:DMT family transporter n=1 Tax=Rhodanobacter sp. AS-Z3 TaxID=3031330 RepID=UPI0024787CE5|nr:DMT family transporter [Rhodanobacter sp. AS-Z3]WEN14210.1 DMT family transporter [Rhodanobacter sp. AS-Z3]